MFNRGARPSTRVRLKKYGKGCSESGTGGG
jgi:hypothetical protein